MTNVDATPPALRWVALFLLVCAGLGLFLGFRDQIRRNPPDWYTGSERLAAPLSPSADGIREAAPFVPGTLQSDVVESAPTSQTSPPPTRLVEAPVETPMTEVAPEKAPETTSPAPAPKARPAPKTQPEKKAPTSADPVGDILESQKAAPAPVPVPY